MELHLYIIAGIAAFLVGLSKSGIPGLGILVVPLMAMVFPAKESVGALLPMLIVGDIAAISYYRRHAQWSKIWRLFPAVIVGITLGFFTLKSIPDSVLRPLLGGLVLILLVLELVRQKAGWDHLSHHPLMIGVTGISAGFATTIGNAAGPIMIIYLISIRMPKNQFIGTAAWFFFLVNTSKVPLFAHLGMITRESLLFDLKMVPMILLGAILGIKVLPHVSQKVFNGIVIVLAALAALRLLWP